MEATNTNVRFCILLALVICVAGCAGQQIRTRSSVVDYLYPNGSQVTSQPTIPVLDIPVKLGIAFVPEQPVQSRGVNMWSGTPSGSALTEAEKQALMETVSDHFRKQKFVSDIQVIPTTYLTNGGSFANLDQIRTMYGIDVIALVSYDQVQFTDEGLLSLSYWTLVGAYIVSGEKNDTSTMMDTAVYDIKSRSLLFRAPGMSNVKGSSTPVNLSEELRADSIAGFRVAIDNMIANLDIQLENFKQQIKKDPGKATVVHRPGYSGGGVVGIYELLLFLIFIVATPLLRRKSYT